MKTRYDHRAVGRAVRRERKRRGLGLRDLAPRARMSVQALNYIERGVVEARVSTLVRIAAALGVDVADLIQVN